jgi:hypothetical protein
MAGTYDFFLSETIDQARDRIAGLIASDGFALQATPNGGLTATRGSAGRTALLGAFAGKQMHVRFDVQFFDDGGTIVARLTRDLASGALKGGVIGASRTADVFQQLANTVGLGLDAAGVLKETRQL